MEEDRRRAAIQKADTEYLARGSWRRCDMALGEVATRDFLRSELARLCRGAKDRGGPVTRGCGWSGPAVRDAVESAGGRRGRDRRSRLGDRA